MAKEKLQAEEHYTFLSNSRRFQSILDKTFTTFPTEHCESTQILDWHTYSKVGLSDHRAVITEVSLSSLCEGWIEYPSKPFRLPPRIDITKLTEESKTKMQEAIEDWKRALPAPIASILLTSPSVCATSNPVQVDMETLQAMHKQLTEVFVNIPERFTQGNTKQKGKKYKTKQTGLAQHVLVWLKRYKVTLSALSDVKNNSIKHLGRNQRKQIQRTHSDFAKELRLQEALPQLSKLLTPNPNDWSMEDWLEHWNTVLDLHTVWKKRLNQELNESKKKAKQKRTDEVFSAPLNSKTRRAYHLAHKNVFCSLPSVMKHPYQADKLITGQAVNDYWGASVTATRPNSMPKNPTEEGTPPWLAPQLWADTRGRIANLENSLLTPLTLDEVSTFLKHTGKSAPGTDRIQYDVLRSMCVGDNFKASKIDEALLNFLNTLLRQKQMPDTMKNAMLTFIYKAGDPLQYGNYRGISLLSCLFKIINGTLNGRLQHILHDKAGLDTNQGANRKGVHAAHKAAIVINIIADAKAHQKPLHIIYTDIKGAFPSVPFQAFYDALTTLGLNNGFLNLVKDTQSNFTCVAKGPTSLSAPKAKENGVHEGDCLSPTLFCLVLNMFFHWCSAKGLVYEMTSHPQSSADIAITIPVNGYADDMALIGKSHGEAVQLLRMLERFLLYFGMELNAGKCGYQYIVQDPADRPQMTACKWGNIPIYHGKKSYKYLGYYLNTQLDFHCQHEKNARKFK
jgi:hypothetical protein